MAGGMNGTIYDDCTRPLFTFDGGVDAAPGDRSEPAVRRVAAHGAFSRVVVIANPRSHRNKRRGLDVPPGVRVESPRTRPELRRLLAELVRDGLDLVIVAGGDGTVRDVLTCGADIWLGKEPAIGVLPCGKTNALALDLGVPDDASIAQMLEGWQAGRETARSPIEIERVGEGKPVLGFLFGGGIFVDATQMAQTTHRWGAVNNLAVGMSVAGAVMSTLFGKANSPWRQGKAMSVRYGADARPRHGAALSATGQVLILLASTMERLPLGIPVFGEERAGLKVLTVDAPQRNFLRSFLRILRGIDTPALERDGIHRVDAEELHVDLEGGFILDGEQFPEGEYLLRRGKPLRFALT